MSLGDMGQYWGVIGLDDLRGISQPEQFCDSGTLLNPLSFQPKLLCCLVPSGAAHAEGRLSNVVESLLTCSRRGKRVQPWSLAFSLIPKCQKHGMASTQCWVTTPSPSSPHGEGPQFCGFRSSAGPSCHHSWNCWQSQG